MPSRTPPPKPTLEQALRVALVELLALVFSAVRVARYQATPVEERPKPKEAPAFRDCKAARAIRKFVPAFRRAK